VAAFSKYIIYADESGSPNLLADAEDYPIFVLNFLVVEKRVYSEHIVPAVQQLKFRFFGHDQIILHEHAIRKEKEAFIRSRLNGQERARFLEALTPLVARQDFAFDCAVVDKLKLQQTTDEPWGPYEIALGICMEQSAQRLRNAGEKNTEVHIVLESRGAKEDKVLELEFRRIASGQARVRFGESAVKHFNWVPVFADKKSNSAGLQIVDLAARPLGLSYLRPQQFNRAFSAMKLTSAENGIKVYP
jgi:Protein of unknown function (DUF3800)